ncbi:unnamed protein product [Lota lota]
MEDNGLNVVLSPPGSSSKALHWQAERRAQRIPTMPAPTSERQTSTQGSSPRQAVLLALKYLPLAKAVRDCGREIDTAAGAALGLKTASTLYRASGLWWFRLAPALTRPALWPLPWGRCHGAAATGLHASTPGSLHPIRLHGESRTRDGPTETASDGRSRLNDPSSGLHSGAFGSPRTWN